ncbi:magnesium-transporting ATPase (P-type) [Sporomusaceae bacterium BoRhaA]|nr:magnesium-transporting ATPase (P-type) [Pelorhabdus rhamnosifermentans]
MFNLIKYELRGKFLTILGICLTVIIGNLFLMTKSATGGIGIPVLSTILGIGALIVIFISSLTLLSDYLYDDQGYLLFTLPQSGVSITASRLIAAVIQISIVAIVSLLMFYLVDQGRILNVLLRDIEVQELIYSILLYIWTIVSCLTFIYFCMVVGKIAFKGKKLGKIGSFIIFFLLSIVMNGLTILISNFFPSILQLGSIRTITFNIGSTLFDIITFAILFMATSYLLEHKVDL